MKNANLDLKSLGSVVAKLSRKTIPYAGFAIFLVFAGAYAFLVLRISNLSNPPVDDSQVTAQVKASSIPHIDSQAVDQLQTLKDNSVNVQTLFQQSRTNPFQE
jgi:hypothetical protein